jgi:uncharacterized protein (TIGR04255 family)
MRIPKRLGKEPLLEVICEIRFTSDIGAPSDVLPGILYEEYRGRFGDIDRLPAGRLPMEARLADPALKYAPTVILSNGQFTLQIGDHMASISCKKPYVGWEKYGKECGEFFDKLRATKLITKPERLSIRYIDILSLDDAVNLNALNICLRVGEMEIKSEATHIRTEITEGDFTHIVQIGFPAIAAYPQGDKIQGLMVDVDTMKRITSNSWAALPADIAEAHELNKKQFFSLLSRDTLRSLLPEYE